VSARKHRGPLLCGVVC